MEPLKALVALRANINAVGSQDPDDENKLTLYVDYLSFSQLAELGRIQIFYIALIWLKTKAIYFLTVNHEFQFLTFYPRSISKRIL